MAVRRLLTVVAAGTALLFAASACSSSKSTDSTPTPTAGAGGSTSSSPSSAPPSSSAGSSAPEAAGAPFGPGCASLGLSADALAALATKPVGDAAATVPFLKSVVTAASVGGLVTTLNAAPSITVFAPTDTAFTKEPPALLQSLLTDPTKKPQLVATLKYHVVQGAIGQAQLAGTHPTLQGTNITIAGSGDTYVINGKTNIVCGGIKTKNATVYIIDAVLHPAS